MGAKRPKSLVWLYFSHFRLHSLTRLHSHISFGIFLIHLHTISLSFLLPHPSPYHLFTLSSSSPISIPSLYPFFFPITLHTISLSFLFPHSSPYHLFTLSSSSSIFIPSIYPFVFLIHLHTISLPFLLPHPSPYHLFTLSSSSSTSIPSLTFLCETHQNHSYCNN